MSKARSKTRACPAPAESATRPAVMRGATASAYLRDPNDRIGKDPAAMMILFGQRARG